MTWFTILDKPREGALFSGIFFLLTFIVGAYTEHVVSFRPFELVSKHEDHEYYVELMYFSLGISIVSFMATKLSFPRFERMLFHGLNKREMSFIYILSALVIVGAGIFMYVKFGNRL